MMAMRLAFSMYCLSDRHLNPQLEVAQARLPRWWRALPLQLGAW